MPIATMKARAVEPRPGYLLALTFSDGTSGVADLRAMLREPQFAPLRDERVFATATLERGSVEWPGIEIGIATEALYALAHELAHPETGQEARANELEVSLRELRKIAGKRQSEIARELEMDPAQVSRLERQDNPKLAALRGYIEALGGKLEVVAVIGDTRRTLRGV